MRIRVRPLALIGVLLFAGLGRAGSTDRNPYGDDARAVLAGAKLYRQHCADCHGAAGQGIGRKPALRSPAVIHAPPGALFRILTNGVMRRGMPSWSRLPEQQRWQIITYLKQLDAPVPEPAAAR